MICALDATSLPAEDAIANQLISASQ